MSTGLAIAAWSVFAVVGILAGLVVIIEFGYRWPIYTTRGRVLGWIAATATVWIVAAAVSWGLLLLAPRASRGLVPWIATVLAAIVAGLALRDRSPAGAASATAPMRPTTELR